MVSKPISINKDIAIESVGDELLVFFPGQAEAFRLSGPAAQAVAEIQAGKSIDINSAAVADLVHLGILSTSTMSRRGLIKASAIGVGAGIAVLAMPTAAAASSPVGTAPTLITFSFADDVDNPGVPGVNGIRIGLAGPPSARVLPVPFPAFGTEGEWAVGDKRIAVVWTEDDPDRTGRGLWLGTAPNNEDPNDYADFRLPANRGILTWTFGGVTFSGPNVFTRVA